MPTLVIRRKDVMRRVGLARTAFDDLRKQPDFPRPIYLTSRTPSWIESEVEEWLAARMAERNGRPS